MEDSANARKERLGIAAGTQLDLHVGDRSGLREGEVESGLRFFVDTLILAVADDADDGEPVFWFVFSDRMAQRISLGKKRFEKVSLTRTTLGADRVSASVTSRPRRMGMPRVWQKSGPTWFALMLSEKGAWGITPSMAQTLFQPQPEPRRCETRVADSTPGASRKRASRLW